MKLTRGRASPVDAAPALDRIDRAILKQLQQDASISNVRLAARVKLSARRACGAWSGSRRWG